MLVTLKVIHNGEIRRFRNIPASYAGISSTVSTGFNLDLSRAQLRYCDSDRDLCSLTPRTVNDALSFLDDENVLRIYVTELSSSPQLTDKRQPEEELKSEDKVEYPGVVCDGCECDPISGGRYKCTVCENFDLCANCFVSHDLDIVDHICRHRFLQIHKSQNQSELSDVDLEYWLE